MSDKYTLEYARREHIATVHQIRNHPAIRSQLVHDAPIPFKDHCKFYVGAYLTTKDWRIYLIANPHKKYPAGYCDIKINRKTKKAEVGFKILPKWQGKGIGTWALKQLVNKIQNQLPTFQIFLTALGANERAIKFYKKYGFVENKVPSPVMIPRADGTIKPLSTMNYIASKKK